MVHLRHGLIISAALLTYCQQGGEMLQAATPREQRSEIGRVARQARLARRFADGRQPSKATAALRDAVRRLKRLANDEIDDELSHLLQNATELVTKAHREMESLGIRMPWYQLPKELTEERPQQDEIAANGAGVSFSRQVAPLLLAKCGRCHVDDQKGGFNLATYANLMRGSAEGGRVLVPGGAEGSVIVDLIESGDMPRGGGEVAPEELQLLVQWIDQGARNDGPNPNLPLPALVGRSGRPPTPAPSDAGMMPEVVAATGEESVGFALEVAPELAESCLGCHGGRNTRADLSMATFAQLLQGGDSGAAIVPGEPSESLLIQRLKGIGGDRMPLNQDPLAPEVIARIETWILEGGHFDGASPDDTLSRTTALARASHANEEELNKIRLELAQRNWRLAIPDEQPTLAESPRFLVMGNLPAARSEALAQAAEQQADEVADVLHHPDDQPLIKSRITLFTMARRFDYSEFGTMVERRELPPRWRGHSGYDGIDAYAVIYPAQGEEFSNDILLAQQIAGVYVSDRSRGRLPEWLVAGAARATAARIDSSDPRVKAWDDALRPALRRMQRPDDFMTGQVSLDDQAVLAYGFASRLLTKPGLFQEVLVEMADGKSLDEAFRGAYRGDCSQLAAAWVRFLGRRR